MDKNYNIVLKAEESFAGAVALGVHVKRPLTSWHFLLPGMFLFDFLRRSSETKRYSALFLFPRKLALNGARIETFSQIEDDIRHWLVSLNLYSEKLHRKQMDVINLLVDHYSKLLHAEGDNYLALIKNAYQTRESYEAYLRRLSTAEGEVDRAIIEIRGETQELMERLRMEQAQVTELRTKEINQIFPGADEVDNGQTSANPS
jgi:hypothetical protein